MDIKQNYYGSQSFSEVMAEKSEKMLFVVSAITFITVLLIKGNNTLTNSFGTNGTLVSYWIAFIVFLTLLAIGTGVLVKYGMDVYPYFTTQNVLEDENEGDNTVSGIKEEKEEFVFKGASTLAPIETVNPVTAKSSNSSPADNGVVVNPVIATAGMASPVMAELLMMEDGNQEDDVIISSSDDSYGYFGDAEDDILWNDPSMF